MAGPGPGVFAALGSVPRKRPEYRWRPRRFGRKIGSVCRLCEPLIGTLSPVYAARNVDATVDVNHLLKITSDRSRAAGKDADTVHVT